jgi:hypothetical protein
VPLLERVDDARRTGAVILALDGGDGDRELKGLAHEALSVPTRLGLISFDGAQHLVSAAAGEPGPPRRGGPEPGPGRAGARTLRGRLARLLDVVSGPSAD